MFDFEKLLVYKKATVFNSKIYTFLFNNKNIDKEYRDQLKRAAFSIPLNIAEGTGRTSKPDRRHFYVIAIGSAFECVAILDQLKTLDLLPEEVYSEIYSFAFEMTKMLFGLEKSLR
ncbi:MAG: four helix bundle protein [Bacteroidetes bacterium]|nr:four helix bundle protein [Bacteroidota bacterium]MBK9523273.1 four helix bundle protein [Bacteroidota bacterium]MBP6648622.1 four helix bundle protein [Bacteroidia bacterium]